MAAGVALESADIVISLSCMLAAAAQSHTSVSTGALGMAQHIGCPPAVSPAVTSLDTLGRQDGQLAVDACLRTCDPAGATGPTMLVSPPPAAPAAPLAITASCDAVGILTAGRTVEGGAWSALAPSPLCAVAETAHMSTGTIPLVNHPPAALAAPQAIAIN
jgi:hypothetical protein